MRLAAAWYLTHEKQGVSALGLQRVLGLGSYQTAWTMLNGSQAVFTVRGDGKGDKPGAKRLARLDGPEFVRRFMLHILPTGSKRIRHYGVLASACKGVKLAAARAALQMPAPNSQALACAQAFMARVARIDVGWCPCCAVGRLRVAAALVGLGRLPGPARSLVPECRGRRDGLAQRDKSAAVCRTI